MHQFLFIRLEGFYIRALLLRDPGLAHKPLILHRDKRVLDINEHASKRQIYRGMPLSEAKAILDGAAFLPWAEEPYRDAQTEWLDVCTQASDVIEPDEQHSAWIDLSLQNDARDLALKLVEELRDRLGLDSAFGLGGSKWIAKLAATCAPRSSCGDVCAAEEEGVAAPDISKLKTRHLTPVEPAHRARLEYLGYATIGDVAAVPLSVLRAQFGDAATHIRMCARGGFFEPVEAVYPPNSLSERFAFDGAVEDSQLLDLGLQSLAMAISQRLTKEDKQSKDLVVTVEHEEGSPTILRRKFTKPIQNYASAIASLRLITLPLREGMGDQSLPGEFVDGELGSGRHAVIHPQPLLQRRGAAPVAIRVRLENATQSKRVQQELTGRNADREQGANAAFQHVRTVFGDTAIQTGDQIVEPRRRQVLRAWKDATGWV